jgi:predicted RNA-binding protein with PUA-like domain
MPNHVKPKQYWLVKSEPSAFSYAQLEKDGKTLWDGVRNYQARNNLQQMRVGDAVLFYHSITDKAVVGQAKVSKESFPEPGDTTGKWVVVEMLPVGAFKTPVTLETIKNTPALADISLVRQGRLSVMPLTPQEFELIVRLGQ